MLRGAVLPCDKYLGIIMAMSQPDIAEGVIFKLLPFTSIDTLKKCRDLETVTFSKTLFITSYPKSGTTWMQAIVFHILNNGKLPLEHISMFSPFYENDKTWNRSNDRIADQYTENHNLLGWRVFNTHLLRSMLPRGDSVRHIYVYRNGRDVAISFFHHLSNQVGDGGLNVDVKQFLIDWCNGTLPFGSWINHLQSWLHDSRCGGTNNMLLMRYEDMINNLSSCILKVSAFLDTNVTDARLTELTCMLSFESMKACKELYQPISVQWKEGFDFLRRGKVGDSVVHFGDAEEALIENMLSREFPHGIPEWFSSLNVL